MADLSGEEIIVLHSCVCAVFYISLLAVMLVEDRYEAPVVPVGRHVACRPEPSIVM